MPSSNGAAARPAPPPAPPLHDFRLDGWLVEPTRNRLVKGGTAIRVRPQLIDILAYLATRPGQVVSKTKLLAEVWSDRHVAETGVARCMAELRQLLADDARRPRIIETVPKRGYRLIARVEGPDQEARPPAASRPVGTWWRGGLASAARSFLAAGAAFAELARHLRRVIT